MAKIFYRNVYGLKKSKNYHFLSNTQRKQRFLFPKWNFVQFSVCLFVCLFVCLSHISKNSNQLGPSFPSQITSQARNQLIKLRVDTSPLCLAYFLWGMWSAWNANSLVGPEKKSTFWASKIASQLLFLVQKVIHPTPLFLTKNMPFSMVKIFGGKQYGVYDLKKYYFFQNHE